MHFQYTKIFSKTPQNHFEEVFFLLHIENRLWNILKDAPIPFIFKTFLYIALNQPDEGIRGFVIDKIQLAGILNLSKPILFRDLKWLKDNLLIHEIKLLESFDFVVNPYFVMSNGDRCLSCTSCMANCPVMVAIKDYRGLKLVGSHMAECIFRKRTLKKV